MSMKVPHLLAKMTHDLPEEGQLIIYQDDGSKLLVLNEVGAAVYFLIDGKKSTSEIIAFLAESFGGEIPSNYERGLASFFDVLEAHRVIQFTDEPAFTSASK
jgi:hypothetical protein